MIPVTNIDRSTVLPVSSNLAGDVEWIFNRDLFDLLKKLAKPVIVKEEKKPTIFDKRIL